MDKAIENAQVEETPKPKRTRRKKVETVEETPKPEAHEIVSKAVVEEKANTYRARVTAALLNVRERPSKASKPIRTIGANDIVEIVENVSGWGKLSGEGYVMLKFVERMD